MPRAKPQPRSTDMAAPERVQMADIARMAGVSASTVSRALSGSPLIAEHTRQRIVELAGSLNYRVNVGAANLRKRDLRTVGVVMVGDSQQTFSDPFLLSLLGTVADALDEHGLSLLLTRSKERDPSQLSHLVNSGQVAGLIIIGQLTWHPHLNQLWRRGLPMAVWGACLPDALYPVVGGDNAHGGHIATQHLLDQGCKHIAFLGDTTYPEARLRHEGYLGALKTAGLSADPRLLHTAELSPSGIRQAVHGWLDAGKPFDGVFAASDVAAIAVLGALSERGVDVPGQVRVVGYDDVPLAAQVYPSLTSIRQPVGEAGRALVALLLEMLRHEPRRTVMLPATLIARASSA
jgi:DNA-binding LacI/PurR family transcriptional regulator